MVSNLIANTFEHSTIKDSDVMLVSIEVQGKEHYGIRVKNYKLPTKRRSWKIRIRDHFFLHLSLNMTCQAENKENFGENESTHFSQGSPLHHLYIDSFMDLESSEVRPTRMLLKLLPKRSTLFPIENLSSPSSERSGRNVHSQDTSKVGVHFSPSSSNLWLLYKDEAEEINSFSPNTVQYPLEMKKTHNCDLQLTPIALSPDDTFYNSKVSYIDLKPKPSRIEAMGPFEHLPISPRYDEIEYLDFISPISESFECRNVRSIYLPSLES